MKRILSLIILGTFIFLMTPALRAQENGMEDVARIAPQHKVKELEKAIQKLQNKIQNGIDRKILSDATAQNLQRQVQAISDQETQYMRDTGAHVLTRSQFKKLHAMVQQTGKAIHQAKQGTSQPSQH
jgi:hypothetical protein